MASELPPEQLASYSAIIDQILASSDLTTISAKRIRKGLQEQVEYDITPQKQPITTLIMARFDKLQNEQAAGADSAVPEQAPTTNGNANHKPKPVKSEQESIKEESTELSQTTSPVKRKADNDSDELSEVEDSPPPKKVKKTKSIKPETMTDEQLAKRMQAELNAQSGRATRGGGPKKKPLAKEKKAKKKSKAKVGSDDDSDVDANGGEKSPKKKGGFHKLMNLSEPLSAMLDQTALSRPETVKQIWAYVKERDMQDPDDRRQIRCDDAMRAVFKQDKVHMFTMNKLLAHHLSPVDEA